MFSKDPDLADVLTMRHAENNSPNDMPKGFRLLLPCRSFANFTRRRIILMALKTDGNATVELPRTEVELPRTEVEFHCHLLSEDQALELMLVDPRYVSISACGNRLQFFTSGAYEIYSSQQQANVCRCFFCDLIDHNFTFEDWILFLQRGRGPYGYCCAARQRDVMSAFTQKHMMIS